MFNLIRNEVMADDPEGPLSGEVEADETWHGGKLRNSDRRKAAAEGRADKGQYVKPRATVLAIVERGGRVIAMHAPSRYGYTLRANIRKNVVPGSTVYTDDFKGYDGIERVYNRHTINHT